MNMDINAFRAASPASAKEQTDLTASPAYRAFLSEILGSAPTVLLDTKTIMKGTPFVRLFSSCLPLLRQYNLKFSCPFAVFNEISAQLYDTDAAAAGKAAAAIRNLKVLEDGGYMEYIGSPNDMGSGQSAVMKQVLSRVWNENVVVFTQSARLAADCETLSNFTSIHLPHTVKVKRIADAFGRLESFERMDAYRARIADAQAVLRQFGL